MSTGVAFFAYNTPEIDYIKLATLCSLYVKRNMEHNQTCLITDIGSWDYFISKNGADRAEELFNHVVITDDEHKQNMRLHYDSPWTKFTSNFKNSNKHKVYQYTPFEQTLMLDIDYLVQTSKLDYVFATDEEVVMFHEAESLLGYPPADPELMLKPTGIPMMWSTAVYFNKQHELTKMFFELWEHIAENYDFYKFLYGFGGSMYRTDFCVSIAAHILNGMGHGELIGSFPHKMINMSQRDDIVKINSLDDWVYLVNNRKENWKDNVMRIQREDVHVMNKRSLERHYKTLFELFEEAE